jgi:hypothetical protein
VKLAVTAFIGLPYNARAMALILDYPLLLVLPSTFVLLSIAAWAGGWFASRRRTDVEVDRDAFNVIQTSALTLLGLIIGFTFSMALNRYDQRKNLEEEEANAIGTAYLRAELLPAEAASKVKAALKSYSSVRVRHYTTRDAAEIGALNADIARLQNDMWSAVRDGALAQPDAMRALAVASINDVINSQGYAQAAWWNRIPHGAWILMVLLAICANFLVGLGTANPRTEMRLMSVFPLIVAAAFFLIADIDAPRGGVIRVYPMNLQALVDSLK